MQPLRSERLQLIPLTREQLQLASERWEALETALGLQPAPVLLGEPVKRAFTIKLQKIAADPQNHLWYTYWLMVDASSYAAVGLLGFKGRPNSRNEVEIGYGTFAAHRSKGYMSEAVRRLVEWAHQQQRHLWVIAETDKTNRPSHRVLEKNGFYRYRETDEMVWWQHGPFLDLLPPSGK